MVPRVRLTLVDTNGYTDDDLAYCASDPSQSTLKSKPPPTRTIDLTKAAAATQNGNGYAHGSSRPASNYPPSSSLRASISLDGHERPASTGHSSRSNVSSSEASYAPRSLPITPPRSRPSSQRVKSDDSIHSLPPSPAPHANAKPPIPAPVPTTASPAPLELLSPPRTPKTPQSLPLKHKNVYDSDAQPSKTSLVPSEGEDMDAFHVRNTYAQLDMSGVKGDGYEEGVERTRARVGTSRASQLNADEALGDGSEKTQELNPKEIQTLASLDRYVSFLSKLVTLYSYILSYGFFTVPSHDRLVLLEAALLLKPLSPVTAGSPSAPSQAKSLSTLPPPSKPIKEASRIEKWTRMLIPHTRDQGANIETWRIKPSKESKLRERTYKGIPDRWRAAAWDLLMSRFSRTGKAEMTRYSEEYRDAMDKPSTYDIQIDLDVPRTISGHIMFRTRYGAGYVALLFSLFFFFWLISRNNDRQRSLFHVLHCFSLRCETCGYVQGMGPIAATLLCYFEPERVYASLVRLHDAYSMHSIFSPGFPGLLEAIYIQERITEQMMPDVYAAFKKHMVSTMSYATKWYITLFANSVPFQTQLRLWDAFLLEGYDVFVAVAVAIVWVYRGGFLFVL